MTWYTCIVESFLRGVGKTAGVAVVTGLAYGIYQVSCTLYESKITNTITTQTVQHDTTNTANTPNRFSQLFAAL